MRSRSACAASLVLALSGAAGATTLPELMARMAESPGVEARFVETREISLLELPLTSRGVLYFVPPDRLARFTREPGASALILDGERLRYREGEGETADEIDLSASPAARGFADNLITLFRGDLAELERLYETDFRGEGERWTLRLVPRRAPLARFLAHIELRGDAGGLHEVELLDRDGDRTHTVFEGAEPRRRFSPEERERLFVEGLPLP